MHEALEPILRAETPASPLLNPSGGIDLAAVLGVSLDEVGLAAPITIRICNDLASRTEYWSFLAKQGFPGRAVQEAHPRAVTILAQRDGCPLGAAALLPSSSLDLPMPDAFRPVLVALRRQGRRIAALDPFVLDGGLPANQAGLVLRALLRIAMLYARRLDGLSDLLVRSEPRYAKFFSQALLFAVEAETKAEGVRPAEVLLRLDLDLCPAEYIRLYGDFTWSPYTLYIKPTLQSSRLLSWLSSQRMPPSPSDLLHGWIDPGDGSAPVSAAEIAGLRRLYPHLAELTSPRPRRECSERTGTGIRPRLRTPLPLD